MTETLFAVAWLLKVTACAADVCRTVEQPQPMFYICEARRDAVNAAELPGVTAECVTVQGREVGA